MNREILFKAKRKDNGEWVEGYYVYCRKRHYILPVVNKAIGFDERENEWVEINSETLCQYTGLTDKNIWENDIVRNEKGDIGVVQWFEEHAAFMIWNKTKNCVCYLAENDFSKIEVIGNIFDNPELLEVE
jgi:uncharacterized phage protein (TIGR01671 family)